jgi:hypothetical protein
VAADVKGLEIKILRLRAGIHNADSWPTSEYQQIVGQKVNRGDSNHRRSCPQRIVRVIKGITNGAREGK